MVISAAALAAVRRVLEIPQLASVPPRATGRARRVPSSCRRTVAAGQGEARSDLELKDGRVPAAAGRAGREVAGAGPPCR
jgi:hypothetical protein